MQYFTAEGTYLSAVFFDILMSETPYQASLHLTDSQGNPIDENGNLIVESVVVLDVFQTKKNIEIVGWHELDSRGLEKLKKQAAREDGQLLILSPENRSAAALSALPCSLLSADKNSTYSEQNKNF